MICFFILLLEVELFVLIKMSLQSASLRNVSLEDDDEEIIQFLMHINRPRTFQDRINHINKWDEADFFRRFRLKKCTFMYVLGRIEAKLVTKTNR